MDFDIRAFATRWALSHRYRRDDGPPSRRRPISGLRLTPSPRCRWSRRWCCGASTAARAAIPISPGARLHRFHSRQRSPRCRRAWRGAGEHNLDGIALIATELGPPALADSLAIFECARESVQEAGDHAILIGRVLRFARQTARARRWSISAAGTARWPRATRHKRRRSGLAPLPDHVVDNPHISTNDGLSGACGPARAALSTWYSRRAVLTAHPALEPEKSRRLSPRVTGHAMHAGGGIEQQIAGLELEGAFARAVFDDSSPPS